MNAIFSNLLFFLAKTIQMQSRAIFSQLVNLVERENFSSLKQPSKGIC